MSATFELIRERKGRQRISACTHAHAEKLLRGHVLSVAEALAVLRLNPMGVLRINDDTMIRYNPAEPVVRRPWIASWYPPKE